MKHKHCDLIKAWADGATIEGISPSRGIDWWMVEENPDWANTEVEYRIKPEPKPDFVLYFFSEKAIQGYFPQIVKCSANNLPNLRLIWDGETGDLIKAEVLK